MQAGKRGEVTGGDQNKMDAGAEGTSEGKSI